MATDRRVTGGGDFGLNPPRCLLNSYPRWGNISRPSDAAFREDTMSNPANPAVDPNKPLEDLDHWEDFLKAR